MPKILHLGIGNFHRAHQAWYTQRANQFGGEQWSIVGVSLKRPYMRDSLAPQGFEFTLAIKSADGVRYDRMSIHDDVLVAPENTSAVVEQIANADTAIITLTVTEKGYHIDPATARLDTGSQEIVQELASGKPKTAIGFLVHGLLERRTRDSGPLTIMSCDNLAENGHVLEMLIRDFAAAARLDLAEYLDKAVTFPNTMVDRIVPATISTLCDEVKRETGFSDASPVSTEAFSEWVIEDKFAGPRPAWENTGATIVEDVQPFELRKLRLLNGAHSLLAYSGLLAGHKYVHEAVADPKLRKLAEGLMAEATETLPTIIKPQAPAYCDALFDRFANASLNHKLAQIAMDGSVKLSVRILPVLERQTSVKSDSFSATAVAFWLAYVLQQLENRTPINDPNATEFQRLSKIALDRQDLARRLLNGLGPIPQFEAIVAHALAI